MLFEKWGSISVMVAATALAGCGGSSGSVGQPPARSTFSVGGVVSGLRAGDAIVLKNGADTINVSSNGTFSFPTALRNGAQYEVRAETPPGYSCKATNNSGVIDGADVTKVAVGCFPFVMAGKPALIQQPGGVAVDGAGNTYVLDVDNQVVLKLDPSGKATIVAGAPGVAGYRDGKGEEARFHFNARSAIALDSMGNLGIVDGCNGVIRKMTPDGVVTTFSGAPTRLCLNYHPSTDIPPQVDDGDAKSARFGHIFALASDRAGGFYVADFEWATGLRHVLPTGRVVSVRWPYNHDGTNIQYLTGLAVDGKGVVWFGDDKSRIWKYAGGDKPSYVAGKQFEWHDGTEPADGVGSAAEFAQLQSMTIDAADNIYVGDIRSIRKVTPAGAVSTVAGSVRNLGWADGVGKNAQLGDPIAMASDPMGNLVFVEYGYTSLRRLSTGGAVTTIESTLSRAYVDGAGEQARLDSSRQPAVDGDGNLYVTDPIEHVIRKIAPDGTVSLFAGARGVKGSLDGPLASATFDRPTAIAAGPGNSLYLIDGYQSARLRRIADGKVSTVVPWIKGDWMFAIAVDSVGKVAISGPSGVYGVSPTGEVSVLADMYKLQPILGQAAEAFLPQGLAYDAAGNLYISDTGTVAIYKLGLSGSLSVFAGSPLVEGDEDGPVGKASFGYYGVDEMTIDADGNLYLSGQGRLRKISAAGVASTPDMAWGNPYLHGLAWRNGKLYGMTRYAALQILTP